MKILFLLPYPVKQAPSQRFRVEQYLGILLANGHSWVVQSFLLQDGASLFDRKRTLSKGLAVIAGIGRRIRILFSVSQFDFIFIHREAAPVGPPVIEWIIARVLRKKIIYDFDDAIWMTDNNEESVIKKTVKWRRKVKAICRWSYKVSCGNEWLCDYARQYNKAVVLNPTTIDTVALHRRELYPEIKNSTAITIGWTGSYTTLKYIQPLEPALQFLEKKYPALRFLVIADQPPALRLTSLHFRPWSMASEIQDLMLADIGVMPLPDDDWSKGKCGFKALQYMALEIPTVLSPVGVNTTIVSENVNGFFALTVQQWISQLERLIEDASLRQTIGKKGRATVEEHYSVLSNTATFLTLIDRSAISVSAIA